MFYFIYFITHILDGNVENITYFTAVVQLVETVQPRTGCMKRELNEVENK